jgi:DNA-binding transcriptional LysR family regulator
MELRHLSTFRAVAEALSFTRAASRLGYAQSSVTDQVKALERDLGVPLFDRPGRKVVLTEAGRRLLPYAEKVLLLAEEARDATVGGDEPQGTLTFSAPESICAYRLPPLLQSFRARHPEVRLVFRPMPSSEMRRGVEEGEVDAAFVLDEPFRELRLGVEPLVSEPLAMLVSCNHPLSNVEAVKPSDLASEPVLLTEEGCSYRSLFLRWLSADGVRPSALEFGSVEAIKQCVMAGMGVAVLPEVTVGKELSEGRLVEVSSWRRSSPRMYTHLVWHRERWQPPTIRAFLAEARELLGQTGL